MNANGPDGNEAFDLDTTYLKYKIFHNTVSFSLPVMLFFALKQA